MNKNQQIDSPPTPEHHEEFQVRMMKERLQKERRERLIRQMFNEDQEKEAQVYRSVSSFIQVGSNLNCATNNKVDK